MAKDLESRAREMLLRLGSVPGDPLEARAFMQRRVRLYLAVILAIWGGVFLIDRIITLAFTGQLFWGDTSATKIHGGIIVVLVALYAFIRFGERSVVATGLIELFATAGQAFALSVMFSKQPLMARPDLMMVLAATHVLVLRAAIVPGTPRRAFGVGLLASAPIVVISGLLHQKVPEETGRPPVLVLTIGIAVWCLISIGTTSAMAAVIYGLSERVRAAMKLGQYTLLGKIGEGGMGVVYRARHTLLRRATAVKVLGPKEADAAMIARFEREVQLTSEIAHPNVVSVYDFGRTPDGAFYYAMEFLEGIDLQRLVDLNGAQPPARVVRILEQVAEALAEAHSVGLIHRDIKPANIVLCRLARRPDLVKVVDFGLVKQVGKAGDADPILSAANVITGTPLYMPPEALTSPEEIDGRSDLYALGAVAYFLLTGTTVFMGKTVLEVCAQTLHEPVIPPSKRTEAKIPDGLEALVLACLAKKKSERPDNAEAFLASLRAFAGDLTWTREDARTWWKQHGDLVEAPAKPDRTPFTRTLAIAPRS